MDDIRITMQQNIKMLVEDRVVLESTLYILIV